MNMSFSVYRPAGDEANSRLTVKIPKVRK